MLSQFVAFTSLGRRALPNQYDVLALVLIFAAFIAAAHLSSGLTLPIAAPESTVTSLDYALLPYYALRTTLRMFAAMGLSLVFTFIYATLAAKSRRAELVLIPILDVLQSVPILGFLSFTVTFFLGLFPGSILGAECAAIFAIFTSQAWNMAFSFYQSLRSVPRDLTEVAQGFQLSGWQRFWQLDAPFAMPGLIWNMMMSMSGGWFFVVAAEAISVGDTTIKLPGIGSYLALAIEQKRIDAVFAAIVAMAVVILLYDQLLFRPLVAFGSRFRVELSAGQVEARSWVAQMFARTRWLRALTHPPAQLFQSIALLRLQWPRAAVRPGAANPLMGRIIDIVWLLAIAAVILWAGRQIVQYVSTELSWSDFWVSVEYTCFTMLRVIILMILATIVWVPVGVWIGLRPRIAEKVQPLAQFLAAFPANVIFPIAVVLILRFSLNPDIWLSPLIVFGTQWYILFNVIAGASAFPNDLKEAVAGFRIRGWDWWKSVIIPAVFPFYVTGALTASGGSWNAAIVAEYVKWGDKTISAHGIGAYIAKATEDGDFPKIVLGVAVMSVFVILFNRLLWRPLFGLAERRLRLD
ncbi:Sulfonate ABC transporter permease [Methylocella tundrae]|uniref:Sulfonate ABC transporter permease n=1 Tax=Methylocella tundrae TaxID=227605 RepID=A0A8B6MBZ8_METTU|nr:ABC transporter permease subunit [Methylocella tundrae]VTZ51546.1 Sulfonate ABC transporter permease [Methylocella tundrae]